MSHYKINERKCSTTFFPFDFIFLFNTDGGDGDGSRGIPRLRGFPKLLPAHHSQSRLELLPRTSGSGTTAYLRFLPRVPPVALWQSPGSDQPRAAAPEGPQGPEGPEGRGSFSSSRAQGSGARGAAPGSQLPAGSAGGDPGCARPGAAPGGSSFCLLRARAAPAEPGPALFPRPPLPFFRRRWWPLALPHPIRALLPRDSLCLLPVLRVPELSLCLPRPLGLCSLPAVLLYIPKIL